jgi:hypothetical protein
MAKVYLTSPSRSIRGAFGCMSRISLGSGPLGPFSADVDMMTGRLKRFPSAECARMLLWHI